MGQPIRKKIQEIHQDLITEKPFYTLLVDGNSLLFFSMADSTDNIDGTHVGGVFQFLLQLKIMMSKRDFEYVFVFFDNEHSGWLRWNLYKPYKANRDKHYENYGLSEYMKEYNENLRRMQSYIYSKNKKKETDNSSKKKWEDFVDENFDRERDILLRYFEELYIRSVMDEVTEGDDFIAYYCMHKKPNEKIYIMSGDMDLAQLLADDIAIYNLNKKKFITNTNFKENFGYHFENTLVKKIFCGDTSDNIGNIKGLSEEGFKKLMPEYLTKKITIEDVKKRAQSMINERISNKKKPLQVHENIINGVSNKKYDGDFYEINEKIIDLKHPLLSKEGKETIDSMMYAPQDPDGRSFENLYNYIMEDGITDLMGATKFASFFLPFKKLEEKEVKRYKESQK
jgi:5'-3' exonuclease